MHTRKCLYLFIIVNDQPILKHIRHVGVRVVAVVVYDLDHDVCKQRIFQRLIRRNIKSPYVTVGVQVEYVQFDRTYLIDLARQVYGTCV